MPSWAWPDLSKVKPRPTSILKFPERGWVADRNYACFNDFVPERNIPCLRGGDVEYLQKN